MVAGLTGGIGSGKSQVAQLFCMLGWKHFNSDAVAKNLYFNPAIKAKIIALLGSESYSKDGGLNKPYISNLVFTQPDLLKQLNAILHPAVGEKFKTFCIAHPKAPILKESALLFETGLNQHMDKIVLVVAPDLVRIQRVMQRDNLSQDVVINKMKSQNPQEENIKKADFVIVNDEQHSLIDQVLKTHQAILPLFTS
ncbi:MAG: dephospho-CoA kinase [Bacteroidia bacterium]|nr:dephospho-CoA kinase [Bacteroidia bacterium]